MVVNINSINNITKTRDKGNYRYTIQKLLQVRFGKNVAPSAEHVTNLSAHVLDATELFVLSHGLNFSLPPKFLKREEIYAEFEVLMAQLNHQEHVSIEAKRELKASLIDCAYGYCNSPIDNSDRNMVRKCRNALRQLTNNEAIRILKPDKGSGVVTLNTDDYNSKMNLILKDTTKFEMLGPVGSHDRTAETEKEITKFLTALCKNQEISEEDLNDARPIGALRPRLYGLPKTHKDGIPLRPILSMIRSAQHKLAQWLDKVIKPVLELFFEYCVKDSFTFSKTIQGTPNTSALICSFDIKSLFTNVPLQETISICADSLYNNGNNPGLLKKDNFIKLMNFATNGVEFSFNNIMYRQIDGVARGSPLGPSLANIYVGYFERRLFQVVRRPSIYLRYVDDTFVLIEDEAHRSDFHQALNDLHPGLKFTCETEKDNRLPFLDVCVEKVDQQFVTSVYRKPTFTGQYVRWNSFCDKRRKKNLIKTLIHRAMMICSKERLSSELEYIKSTLINNGYPERIISKIIKSKLGAHEKPQLISGENENEARKVYLRLPYAGAVSAKYAVRIKGAVSRCYANVSLRIIFKSRPILPAAIKDVLPTHTNSNIIYQYLCHCKSAYVGRTARRLQVRIGEHIPMYVRNKSASLKGRKPSSSIAQHLVENPECREHYNDLQFTILGHGRTDFHLSVLEAMHIMQKQPILCRQKKFVYTTVLFKSGL